MAETLTLLSADALSVPAERRAPQAVRVRAATGDGNPQPGTEVRFRLEGDLEGSLSQPTAQTSSRGEAATYFHASAQGSGWIVAQSGDAEVRISVTVVRAPGELILAPGSGGSGLPGLAHPDSAIDVTVLDTEGVPMPDVTVWFATSGTLSAFADTTDATGRAGSVVRTTRLQAGSQTVVAFIVGFPELTQTRSLLLDRPAERVLLVSVAGLRADALDRYAPPALLDLRARAAWWADARTVLPSLSVPAHLSMWSSVPPAEHGVQNDSLRFTPEMASLDPLFKHVDRAGIQAAAFLSPEGPLSRFGELLRCRLAFGFDSLTFTGPDATEVVDAALPALRDPEIGLVFVHLQEPDLAGRAHGFESPEYQQSVAVVDHAVDRLLEAAGPSTLVLLTSPHGGGGAFGSQLSGSASDEDVRIPLMVAGPSVRPGPRTQASVLDVAPTLVWALGLSPVPDYQGRPLLEGWRRGNTP